MKLCVLETRDQVKTVLINWGSEDLLFISLSPEVSYELFSNGRPFLEAEDLIDHETIWNEYPEITKTTFDIARQFDDCVSEFERGCNYANSFFCDHHYILKVNYDQLHFFASLLDEILRKYGGTEFICFDENRLELDDYGFIKPEINLFSLLLKENSKRKNLKITFLRELNRDKKIKEPSFSFGQPLKRALKNRIISFLIEKFQLIIKGRNKIILSVGCRDLNSMASEIKNLKKYSVIKFYRRKYYCGKDDKKYIGIFSGKNSIVIKDVEISQLMIEVAEILSKKISAYRAEMTNVAKYLDKLAPKFVVFQSLAPLYEFNPLVVNWCKKNNIPYTCWMHGGYGGNFSLPGYDVTDYKLSKHHIVYGQANADIANSSMCVLQSLSIKRREVHPIGAYYFTNIYKNSNKYLNTRVKAKKTITYYLGALTEKNQFYYGYHRKGAYYSIWKEHYKVIKVLIKFQKRYNIVIKDYPKPFFESMWKKMLSDLSGHDILYITCESTFQDVLEDSDLNIFPWVSTTFHQALFIDKADIFLFDTGDMVPKVENEISGEIFYSKNITRFCEELESYLVNGNFYKNSKHKSREYFLNWSRSKFMALDFTSYLGSLKKMNLEK